MPAYITGLNIVAKNTDGQVTPHIGNDLGVDVNPFNYEMIGVKRYFGGESDYAVLDGYTNYIYVSSDGYLSSNTNDYPLVPHIRLGRVVTLEAKISNIIDDRAFFSAMSDSPTPGPHADTHKKDGDDDIKVEEFGTDGYKGRVPVSNGSGTLIMSQPLGSRVLLVGSDFEYPSLKSALTAAALLSPSQYAPLVISIAPGMYVEDNSTGPIELLDNVYISSMDPSGSVLFAPMVADNFLFRSSPDGYGSLSCVGCAGCSGALGGAILIDRGTVNIFSNLVFVGCSTCVRATGTGVQAVCESTKAISCYNVFLSDSEAAIISSNLVAQEILGVGFSSLGGVIQADSFTFMASSGVGAKGCVVDYAGQAHLKSGLFGTCYTAVECNNAATVRLDLIRIENSDAYDIFISDAVSVIRSSSSEFTSDKIYNPNNAPILGFFRDTEDNIMKIAGSLDMISGSDTWMGIPRKTEAEQSTMVVGWGEEEEGRQWFNTTKNKFVYWNGHVLKYIVPTQVVTVGVEGADYTSISAALASITDASAYKPYTILVNSGVYMELPFSLKQYVSLFALGTGTCVVMALNNNSDFITLSASTTFDGFTIMGPTGSEYSAIVCNDIDRVKISNCQFQRQNNSIKAFGSSTDLIVEYCRFLFAVSPISCAILSEDNASVCVSNCNITATTGLYANGGTIEAQVLKFVSCTSALYANNIGVLEFQTVDCDGCTYSIRTGETGENEIQGDGLQTENTVNYDIYQENMDSAIVINNAVIEEDKLSITNWENIFLSYFSNGEASLYRHTSDLRVGIAELGNKTMVGEGGSHNRGMFVFTTDSTASSSVDGGNLTNVLDYVRYDDGYSATFQGTTNGYSILIGSSLIGTEVIKHWGLHINQTTAAVENTKRSFMFEIWNGSAWVEVNIMSFDFGNYYKYSNEVFIRENSCEGIFYGINSDSVWAKKTISGQNLYWSRIRIKNTLTTLPEFNQIRLFSSSSYFGENGYLILSGNARAKRTYCSLANYFGDEGGIATSNINIGSGGVPTGWTHMIPRSLLNGNGDAIQYQFTLPSGIDTSMPLSIKMNYSVVNTGTGNATFIASMLPIEVQGVLEADPTGGTVPVSRTLANTETIVSKVAQTVTNSSVLTSVTNKLQSITFDGFSISNYYTGDMVAIRLEMDVRSGSQIAIWDLDVLGTLCALGENK